jgi:hypothetical protein
MKTMELVYDGDYGRFVVDPVAHRVIEDALDRDAIWAASGENYQQQSTIYSEIADALLESGDRPAEWYAPPQPPHRGTYWGGEELDFGFRIYFRDGWVLDIEADPVGTGFFEQWPSEDKPEAWAEGATP